MSINKYEQLKILLKNVGILYGDDIIFEYQVKDEDSSKENFGELLEVLKSIVMISGNIFIPTCTPPKGFPEPTFDPQKTPSDMGLFSEYFRTLPDVIRSHNPTHSIAGLGPNVVDVLKDHRSAYGRFSMGGDGAFGYESPWDKLMGKSRVYWVLISDSSNKSPIRDFLNVLFYDKYSGLTKTLPFPDFDLAKIIGQLKLNNFGFHTLWNKLPVYIFKFDEFMNEAINLIEVEPAFFDPRNVMIEWLEIKKNLTMNGYLLAGFSKVKISPKPPIARWEGKKLTGIYRDLFARAMVLSHREFIFGFVLLDLLGISNRLVKRIRSKIEDLSGGEIRDVMIACTHSHSTPDTLGSGFESSEYIEFLIDSVSKAVIKAKECIEPVRAGFIQIPIRGIAHSRRNLLKDGTVFTTRYGVPSTWRVNKELIQNEGEMDPTLSVIKFENLANETVGILTNFGCHASVALMSKNISGDFPGEAMHLLELTYDGKAVALCTNGSAADIDPTLEMPYWGPRNDKNASRIGRIFGAQVIESVERVQVKDLPNIGLVTKYLDLEVRDDWILLLSKEMEKMQQEFSENWKFSEEVQNLYESGIIHTEVQGMRINDLYFIGYPGEVFTETGFKLKEIGNKLKLTVVPIELVNDNVGYLVTEKIFNQGGYEAGQHLWGRTNPQAEEKLLEVSELILRELAKAKN